MMEHVYSFAINQSLQNQRKIKNHKITAIVVRELNYIQMDNCKILKLNYNNEDAHRQVISNLTSQAAWEKSPKIEEYIV
jgi:hypothetical protein